MPCKKCKVRETCLEICEELATELPGTSKGLNKRLIYRPAIEMEETPDPEPIPTDNKEDSKPPSVVGFLSNLTSREREIINYRYGLDGITLTTREVARRLKIKTKTVNRIEHRALDKMRAGHGS